MESPSSANDLGVREKVKSGTKSRRGRRGYGKMPAGILWFEVEKKRGKTRRRNQKKKVRQLLYLKKSGGSQKAP